MATRKTIYSWAHFVGVFTLLVSIAHTSDAHVDRVMVDKSKRRMYLIENGEVVREFRIALGKSPKGHKQQEGDQRTPEGTYLLRGVNPQSNFYKSMHITYPNQDDRKQAKARNVNPGGDISVHGLKIGFTDDPQFIQSFDWTNGCIAITNEEMDEFLENVADGTPIDIEW